MVQDPLDREIRDESARELTEHVGKTILNYHPSLQGQWSGREVQAVEVAAQTSNEIGCVSANGNDGTRGAAVYPGNSRSPPRWRVRTEHSASPLTGDPQGGRHDRESRPSVLVAGEVHAAMASQWGKTLAIADPANCETLAAYSECGDWPELRGSPTASGSSRQWLQAES